MLWAKVLLPVLLVGAGGTAAVAATRTSSGESVVAANAAVWIDNPSANSTFAPGTVSVDAHAVADADITALELYVDGDRVTTDADLVVAEDLVYATFAWDATVGSHSLVVAQVGGDGVRSDPRPVDIVEGAPDAPRPEETTTTVAQTTTTAPGDTTTTAPEATTTVPTPETTTPPPPQPTTTLPPTTTPTVPAVPPTIDSATTSGSALYRFNCGYPDVLVSARVHDASSVTVILEGTAYTAPMTRSGSAYSASIPSGIWGTGDVGTHRIVVEARSSGGRARATAGSIDIKMSCPKD